MYYVTFLNIFAGADPFDTNSLTQVFCEEDERLEKDFDSFDAAIDELCEHLGQETPESAAAEAAAELLASESIPTQPVTDNTPF